MPEGPEVKITCENLRKALLNKNIGSITILQGSRYEKKSFEGYSQMHFPLLVKEVSSKGKFMYILFSDESSLWITLGMSGFFTVDEQKHNSYCIIYGNYKKIYFNDVRHFGTIKFVKTRSELDKKLLTLGPDMLDLKLDKTTFKKRFLKHQDKEIVVVLVDQKVVSGLGNYLRADILYKCRIAPMRCVSSLSEEDFERLWYWSRILIFFHYDLKLGIKEGIIPESEVANLPKVQSWENSLDYNTNFYVYSKSIDPYGNPVSVYKDKNKRTVHWVPILQY